MLQIEDVFVESIGANICTVIGLKSSLSNVCKGNRILPNWLKLQLIVNEGGRHPAAPGSNPKHTNYAFFIKKTIVNDNYLKSDKLLYHSVNKF